MPDISRIKLITAEDEEETYQVKDTEVSRALEILLGEKYSSLEEEN